MCEFYFALCFISLLSRFPSILFSSFSRTNVKRTGAPRFFSSAPVSVHIPHARFSLLFCFFLLLFLFFVLLDATFAPFAHLVHGDFYPFFLSRFSNPPPRQNLRSRFIPLYSSFPRSTLTSLFVHFALLGSLPLLYLFPGVLLPAHSMQPPPPSRPPIPHQVFHARKRVLSYFSSRALSFPRVLVSLPPQRALARAISRAIRRYYVTFSAFLFGMYARYPIRDPFHLVSILSFSAAQSAFLGRSHPGVFTPRLSLRRSIVFAFLPSWISLYLKFLALRYFARRWAIHENTIRSIPSHYPR